MQPSEILKGSDGTGNAVLAHVTLNRIAGSSVLKVDSVSKWNTNSFIATVGTVGSDGFITPGTVTEFVGHITAGDIIIDSYEPGFSDLGNTAGQVVVVKQTTGWANRVASQLATLQVFTPMSGIIAPFAGRVAPTNWLFCDGSLVSRGTYPSLFAAIVPNLGAVTMTIATPGVFTLNNHNLQLGDPVYLTTTGALPTGLTANTTYYAIPINANTFNLATTLANAIAGTKIATSGTQSGTHSLFHVPYGIGDGSTTFQLPDLRSRSPIGAGLAAPTIALSFAATDVNTATDVITVPSNQTFWTGQVVRLTTTSGLPAGLATGTDYYVIRISDTQIKLATTRANASLDGGTAIDITSQGTGTHTMTQTLTQRRLGDYVGEEMHTLTDADMPQTRIWSEAGDYWNQDLGGGVGGWAFNPGGANNGIKKVRVKGGQQAHNIVQPGLAVNYIIKT